MRKQKRFLDRAPQTAALICTAVCLCASALAAQTVKVANLHPTAIAGESWLTHLQRSFDETSMGKTGRLGPHGTELGQPEHLGDDEGNAEISGISETNSEPYARGQVLHGSDLYRMNCRGCHGEDGSGAPPEINSVINPVRATSTAAMMERMKATGMPINRADAAKLAQQSNAMLLDRLRHGGQDMPAFPHLNDGEVHSLIAYLRQLAGVRGAEREQLAVREERVRVGELIAKSTCHICHSAAGPNPTPQQLYNGVIPPLSTLTMRTTSAEFIRKVTRGAPVMMGSTPESLRGRMPVFYYLSEEEAADIYLFLMRYPPSHLAVAETAAAGSYSQADAIEMASARPVAESSVQGTDPAQGSVSTAKGDVTMAAVPMIAGSFAALLMGLGLAFTVYEVRRLSRNRKVAVPGGGDAEPEDEDIADGRRELDPELVA